MVPQAFKTWFDAYIKNRVKNRTNNVTALQEQIKDLFEQKKGYVGLRRGYVKSGALDYAEMYARRIDNTDKLIVANQNKLQNTKGGDFDTDADTVYQKLLSHADIKKIVIQDRELIIVTNYLISKRGDFGSFACHLNKNGEWWAQNLTFHMPNFNVQHPHILGNTKREPGICLGDFSTPLNTYDRVGALYYVVDTFIHFLRNGLNPHYRNRGGHQVRWEWFEKRKLRKGNFVIKI